MRRILFTVMASVAITAFVPASAMARSHHKRHHRHHAHARVHRFGVFTPPSTQGTPAPTPPSSSTAGTVTSFDPTTGMLVITLSDGTTTESGLVTSDTEIECQASSDTSSSSMLSEGDGGSSGGGDQSGGDGTDSSTSSGDDSGEDSGQTCSTANLTPGTVVLGAELKIGSSGATWDKIELMS